MYMQKARQNSLALLFQLLDFFSILPRTTQPCFCNHYRLSIFFCSATLNVDMLNLKNFLSSILHIDFARTWAYVMRETMVDIKKKKRNKKKCRRTCWCFFRSNKIKSCQPKHMHRVFDKQNKSTNQCRERKKMTDE